MLRQFRRNTISRSNDTAIYGASERFSDMIFLVHTMEYRGETVCEDIRLRNYRESDYTEYRQRYEDSFYDIRRTLGLPRECCKSESKLADLKDSIFILEEDGEIAGSVAVYDNEIDDFFVAEKYRRRGYGGSLLRFAVSYLQQKNTDRIILHVAQINKAALELYLNNGFVIFSTEEIDRPGSEC